MCRLVPADTSDAGKGGDVCGSMCWLGGNRYAVLPLTLTSDLGGVQYLA